jgi:hypothetical protein
LRRVIARAEKVGQPDLCGSTPSISLEEHLGRLFFDLSTAASPSNIEAYYDLVRLYNAELLMTSNWMIAARQNGVIRQLVQRELRDASLSVVTFNHDLLIENAIARLSTARYPGAWCFRHAYGLAANIETVSDPSDSYGWTCPGHRDRHVPIFKMHGSCNWVYRTRNEYPSAQVARGDRTLYVWTNKELSQSTHMDSADTSKRGRGKWYMWPLIVPPVYEKHSYITGDLKRIWDAAGDALEAATRIIFWGYSFPRADLHARYFFSSIAHRNEAMRSPILINPDPRSQDELWSVVQPRKVSHYRNIGAFLSDTK